MAAQTPVPGCPRHKGMGFVYVCKSCEDELICMDCVTDRHNGHKMGKLTDYVADQKREIQQYVDKLSRTDIPKIKEDIREQETSGGGYQKVISDIKRQGKQMKDNIDNAIELLVKMCIELEKLNRSVSEKNKTALTQHLREDLEPKLDRCQQVLTSGTTVDVTTLAREIRNTSIDPPSPRRLQTVEFKPGTISIELLERMLGKVLVDGEDQSYKPIPTPVVLSEFTTSFPYRCMSVHVLLDDEAWLSYWTDESVYRVDLKGKCEGDDRSVRSKSDSISVSPDHGQGVVLCR
ncbi:uncharacterized protein LOC117340750 [Pecten maximus]|uniref:uncharacterized protein LOC117340750 n=1 Tax=Pecten maximus TaxID=6579 RepID=UPI001457FDDF|nr:uncharacterized protein LOC117340750 [Pecten maximus]